MNNREENHCLYDRIVGAVEITVNMALALQAADLGPNGFLCSNISEVLAGKL